MNTKKKNSKKIDDVDAKRTLLRALPDSIMELSRECEILDFIGSTDLQLPFTAAIAAGDNVDDVLPPHVSTPVMYAVQQALKTDQTQSFEFTVSEGKVIRGYEARVLATAQKTALLIIRDTTSPKHLERDREKLIQELERKNRESETLRESLAGIVGSLKFSEILENILDQIRRVVPYDSASIWSIEGRLQKYITGRNVPDELVPGVYTIEIDDENSAYPILVGKVPYVLDHNVQADLKDFQTGPHVYIQSWLGLPLKTRGQIIGLIALDGKQKNQFTEHDAELAVIFANQVAVTLENSRLYSELQSELRKQVALRGAITAISSSLRLNEVLNEICRQMAATIDASSAYISSYDPARSYYTVVAEYLGPRVNDLERVSDLGAIYYKKEGAWVFDDADKRAYAVIHADDPDLTSWARHNLESYGGKSVLYIPLYVHDRLIGHAELWEGERKREFTEDEISFCRVISQQAAIAIENANLFGQLQLELMEMRTLVSELEAKNAELERFTYTVSHDLKSPLFTIRGFLGYLEQDMISGDLERFQNDARRIADATEKMQDLLNDLLELSRIGRLMNAPQEVDFDALVRDVLELLHGQIEARGVHVQVYEHMPMIRGDRQRLSEVMQNLVDNAIKFMGNQTEPCIEIGWQRQEKGAPVYFVSDNGIGISAEHSERVFGLFNKLDPHSSGTGIGLSLVKRIIEYHGGRVWVESIVGKGSTFYFTLEGKVDPQKV